MQCTYVRTYSTLSSTQALVLTTSKAEAISVEYDNYLREIRQNSSELEKLYSAVIIIKSVPIPVTCRTEANPLVV
jgi:hypothetical protein